MYGRSEELISETGFYAGRDTGGDDLDMFRCYQRLDASPIAVKSGNPILSERFLKTCRQKIHFGAADRLFNRSMI